MTQDILDPGKGARRQAREQAKLLKQEKAKQALQLAEAEGEVALVKSRATNPMTGKRALISGTQKRESLG